MGLKKIPAIVSPALLKVLSEMGHGDTIVLADIHFPTSCICRAGPIELRADGHKIAPLLDAILQLFPLDEYVQESVAVMKTEPQDQAAGLVSPPVWADYKKCLQQSGEANISMQQLPRTVFYETAKRAYAVLHTGETAKYGNIMLTKGLVKYD